MKNPQKPGEALVQLDVLGARHGHKSETIQVGDDKPERRAELAEHIKKLIKGGFAVMLADGTKVTGYDPETNSWLVKDGKKTEKISAQGKPATATPLPAGG